MHPDLPSMDLREPTAVPTCTIALASSPLSVTRHYRTRSAQRAIPPDAIELLLEHAASARVRGADSYFFDRNTRWRLQADLGSDAARHAERWLAGGERPGRLQAGHRRRRLASRSLPTCEAHRGLLRTNP